METSGSSALIINCRVKDRVTGHYIVESVGDVSIPYIPTSTTVSRRRRLLRGQGFYLSICELERNAEK
jgi:hypothetical protein